MSRVCLISCIVEADDESKDSELVDLATRLGKAMGRRDRSCLVTLEWKTKEPEPATAAKETTTTATPDRSAN